MRQFGGERYGGDVAAARERGGRADRTEKFAVENFRIVIAETVRRVLQQRERMNLPLVERECIDERLQGRTGRTRPPCPVDLAVDFGLGKISGADRSENLHRVEID